MPMKNILFLLLAGAILLTGCESTVESADEKAPDFSLQDINNKTVRLSDYEDDVIILNFFATWCPPCRSEIPDFIELVDEYGKKDFVIIGVSVDRGDAQTVREFAQGFNINYPVLLDDGQVSKTYGPISSIPTTFIIDKKGNIVEKIIGARSKTQFENMIKPLL
jgi:cytochrome c biogenesis protein CcmG/thiol:disulfide interchange protein DsbE